MIQQHQYTQSTPKYNFPQTLNNQTLPQRFIEISLQSLKNIREQATIFQPYQTEIEHSTNETAEEVTPLFLGQASPQLQPIKLKPIQQETNIVAVDVSSIKIGETNAGILSAIRGAIVWKKQRHYHYLRIGPFPFHITEENKNQVYSLFRQYSFNTTTETNAPSLNHITTRMGTLLERWLQMNIATSTQNTIILWDGSLTAGTSDSPTQIITQLLETARNRLNTVLAFTKTTRLRLNGHRLTELVTAYTPPCLLQMDSYPIAPTSNNIHFLGNIYVAKLNEGNCSFRLDIDRKLPQERAIEATQRLLANDLLHQSYPETLRLAHIYSTFTANEVIAIQRFITQTHGLKTVTRPNIRRLLFGPFGKGPES